MLNCINDYFGTPTYMIPNENFFGQNNIEKKYSLYFIGYHLWLPYGEHKKYRFFILVKNESFFQNKIS